MDEERSARLNLMRDELVMIQAIIARLAGNSFLIKGWCVTVVLGTLAVSDDEMKALIAIAAVIVFWVLDAYYVKRERMYRELHRWIVTNRPSTDDGLFDMDASRFVRAVDCVPATMLSRTVLPIYGFMVAATVVYIVLP